MSSYTIEDILKAKDAAILRFKIEDRMYPTWLNQWPHSICGYSTAREVGMLYYYFSFFLPGLTRNNCKRIVKDYRKQYRRHE